jgi:cobalt-zinc-cadmium efflux system membrane fusion protein
MKNAEIRTAKLTPQAFTPRLTTTATIAADPRNIARLGSRVAGRVAAIDVRLGDRVQRGQALVEIDAVELHQVSTEYLTAQARAREAVDALARQKQLVAERVGALQDLRRAEANAEAATATLHEAEEHLRFLGLGNEAIARLRGGSIHAVERSIIRAPIAGRVSTLTVTLGQVLAGTEDLVTITRSDDVWATLRVYERDLGNLAVGGSVEIQVPSYPDRIFIGKTAGIGELVDPATHTIEARVALPNPDGALKPGMSATASIALKSRATELWLPSEAVQPHGTDRAVFAVVGERRFEARPIAVGAEVGGMVPVSSGIAPGTEVVVHGAFALRGELERAELEGE